MDSVTINIIEQIDDISISVTNQVSDVNITVLEQPNNIEISAVNTFDQVVVEVTQSVDRVQINVVEGESGGGGAVDSVNGQTGTVVLSTSDLEEDTDHKYVTDAQQTVIGNTSGSNTGDQDLSGKENVGVAQGIMDTHEGNHPAPTTRDARNQVAGDYEPLKGADDNYVTDAEKIVISNTSNTNSGDQDISGIATNASDITDIENEQLTQNTAIGLNTAKETNVTTDLSEGTTTETTVNVNSSDGTNATLVAASTIRAGVLTKAKFDEVEVNNAKVSYVVPQFIHLVEAYAPSYTMSNTNGSFRIFPWAVELHKDALFTHTASSTDITVGATGWYSLYCAAILSGLNNTEYILQYSVNGVAQTLGYDRRSGYGKTTYDTLTLKFNTEVYLTSGQIVAFRVAVPFPGIAGSVTLAPSQIECIMRKLD